MKNFKITNISGRNVTVTFTLGNDSTFSHTISAPVGNSSTLQVFLRDYGTNYELGKVQETVTVASAVTALINMDIDPRLVKEVADGPI